MTICIDKMCANTCADNTRAHGVRTLMDLASSSSFSSEA